MSHVILLAVLAMILFGLADFFLKKGIDKGLDTSVLFFYAILISAIPFGVLCVIQSISLKIQSPLLEYSLSIAILFFAGTFALLAALQIGEASIVVPIGRMGFVVTAICAFIFIGEQLTITKGLGILSAVTAIILISRK